MGFIEDNRAVYSLLLALGVFASLIFVPPSSAQAGTHGDCDAWLDDGVNINRVFHSGAGWDSERRALSEAANEVLYDDSALTHEMSHCFHAQNRPIRTVDDLSTTSADELVSISTYADTALKASKTGRIDYHNPASGRDGHCSGSVIGTSSGSIILTAAHCVHGGMLGVDYEDIVFTPSYEEGAAPYGEYRATHVFYHDDWSDYGRSEGEDGGDVYRGYSADFAFIVVDDDASGRSVMSHVGGHDIEMNDFTSFNATVSGYPSDIDDSEIMQVCEDDTTYSSFHDDSDASNWYVSFFSMECPVEFGEGASGGPWVTDVEGAPLRTQVKSVTSWRHIDDHVSHGPFLDDRAWSLLVAAENTAYYGSDER